MKKILITGGAGFIGSAVFRELKSCGYDLYIIDNLSFGRRAHVEIDDERFFNVDIVDAVSVLETFDVIKPHWVLHLAALHFIPYCVENPQLTCDVNITGTKNVLFASEHCDTVEKVFFSSTAAVYPISNTSHSESDTTGPMDIYGVSKMAGEYLFHDFHNKTGVPTIICRFFNAFGPNETNPHLIPTIHNQLSLGESVIRLGNLEPKRDFIHTSDMAVAVKLLMEKFESGIDVFNLGQGIEYSVKEIFDAFLKVSNKKLKVEIDLNRVRKVDRMHLVAEISKIKRYINWEPKMSIEEGLLTMIG
jgi:UDP-glucose 4-epimerase